MTPLAVGVIGGMGPAATVHFMSRILALTPAVRDEDHLRLIVDCNPKVPNRNEAVKAAGPSPAETLARMARGLHRAGAEVLVMPCNAAHAFAGAIAAATPLPFIDLFEATADEALALGRGPVGVLAADGALAAGLYQAAFARRGMGVILRDAVGQRLFMELIYRIKAGEVGPGARAEMRRHSDALARAGARVLVAGCTEIPLVLSPADIDIPLVDCVDALARRTIATALPNQ